MRVFAYCTFTARDMVREALGVMPHCSPPWTAESIGVAYGSGYDFLYFRLHGHRNTPGLWFGEHVTGAQIPALDIRNGVDGDLTGATVLIANCYSATDKYIRHFYWSGARAVIAGEGKNYAAKNAVIGTDLLAKWVLCGLQAGLSPQIALALARARVSITAYRRADRVAIGFQIVEDR